MSDRDELIARAKERAETAPTPEDWGYRVSLDEGDSFSGRWRGETTDPDNNNRRVFLFWDEDGELCYSRFYAALGREIDRAKPTVGDTVAVFRSDNYQTQHDEPGEKKGQSYGVEAEQCSDPMPGDQLTDDELPF